MNVVITLELDNEAFQEADDPTQEIANILEGLAVRVRGNPWINAGYGMPLLDKNGNQTGYFQVTE